MGSGGGKGGKRGVGLRAFRTGTCIRIEDGDAFLAGRVLEEALLGTVVAGACQASEIDQQGDLM